MVRVPVSSSDLESVGYDALSHILEIKFHSGGVYQYFDVSEIEHRSLMDASSHGTYFHEHIKNNYRYTKII